MTSMEDLSASCLFVDFINYVLLNSSVVIWLFICHRRMCL